MKTYTQDRINPDLPGVIMMSHGPIAVAVVESLKMVFGESENLAAFSLEPGDDIDSFRKAFADAYESFRAGSLVMVDLYGGTPFNQVLQYSQETRKAPELLTGLNLPMAISAISTRDTKSMSGKSLTDTVIGEAKSSVGRVDVASFLSASEDEDEDED